MNLTNAETLIQEYLSTAWTATKIAWPNVLPADFATLGQPLLPEGTANYIAIRHEFTQSTFITVPGTCRRYKGAIFPSIFVRRETGTRTLAQYTSTLIELFEGRELAFGTEFLRVWTMTGSVDRSLADWYVRELAFGASFERNV